MQRTVIALELGHLTAEKELLGTLSLLQSEEALQGADLTDQVLGRDGMRHFKI